MIRISPNNRVSRREVAEYWAQREMDKQSDVNIEIPTAAYSDLIGVVERIGPTRASRVLWAESNVQWFRVQLSRDGFQSLQVHKCYNGIGWSQIAPDRKITTAARRVRDEPDALDDDVDVSLVQSRCDEYPDTTVDPLILFQQEGDESPWIVDGNHRATGIALHLLKDGEYEPVDAFLGISKIGVREFLKRKLWTVQQGWF